jgi:Tol biopolymer transport system component
MLMVRDVATATERILVPPGTLPDIAYPRYSPSGDRLAFVATAVSASPGTNPGWLSPGIAMAHGQLWNLWVVQRDGSGLRELAPVGADDASVAWSPNGRQLLVYASNGARLVDAATGDSETLGYLAGFGAISWLP